MASEPNNQAPIGRVPPPGAVGRVPSRGAGAVPHPTDAASGDAACSPASRGASAEPPPRRLRRLHRVWPDRDGNISYLLTLCVEGRLRVLNNEATFQRLVSFLLDSPQRYHWFGRRFVLMPDHLHLIVHQGYEAICLGQWVKALKAVVGGLKPSEQHPVGPPGLQPPAVVGRVPSRGGFGSAPAGDAVWPPTFVPSSSIRMPVSKSDGVPRMSRGPPESS